MPNAQLYRWTDIPAEQMNPLLTRQLVSGDQAMISRIVLTKGCLVPTHSHHNEQIATVISGSLRFTLGEPGTTSGLHRSTPANSSSSPATCRTPPTLWKTPSTSISLRLPATIGSPGQDTYLREIPIP